MDEIPNAETSHAPELYVDDPAGPQADRLFGVTRRTNAFIQADGRLQLRLQSGVVDDVIVGERLFDHHQVEFVQPPQVVRVRQRVRRVGIGHELDGGKPLPDLADYFDVPTRLDLDLNALVAGSELRLPRETISRLEGDTPA